MIAEYTNYKCLLAGWSYNTTIHFSEGIEDLSKKHLKLIPDLYVCTICLYNSYCLNRRELTNHSAPEQTSGLKKLTEDFIYISINCTLM